MPRGTRRPRASRPPRARPGRGTRRPPPRVAWAPPPTTAITRSPGRKRVTCRPAATTTPASSMPGMSWGQPGGAGYRPRRWSRSAALTPAAGHGHRQLGVAGHRVGPLLPRERPVRADDHCPHPPVLSASGGRTAPAPIRGNLPRMALYDIPIHTLSGEPSSLGPLQGPGPAGGQRGLQVRAHPPVRRAGAAPGDLRRAGLLASWGSPATSSWARSRARPRRSQTFCSTTYGVTFPLFEKIEVNGEGRHPIYAELTEVPDAEGKAGDITWNFEKFLVSPAGEVVGRFRPQVEPEDPALVGAIEAQLPGLSGRPPDAGGRRRGHRAGPPGERRGAPARLIPRRPSGPPSSTWTACWSTPSPSGTRPRSRSWATWACPWPRHRLPADQGHVRRRGDPLLVRALPVAGPLADEVAAAVVDRVMELVVAVGRLQPGVRAGPRPVPGARPGHGAWPPPRSTA